MEKVQIKLKQESGSFLFCSRLKNDCLCSYQILQNISHLTKEQRFTIFVMKQQGFRNNQIANVIGKDKSVISRELKRNCDKRSGQYRAELAQRKYERRMKEKPKLIKFTKELCRLVETMLKEDYSPEQNLKERTQNH